MLFMDKLKAASGQFGAMLGAGWATGTGFIVYFMSQSGHKAPWVSLIGLIIYYLCFYIGLEIARRYRVPGYEGVFRLIYGKASVLCQPLMEFTFLFSLFLCVLDAFAGGASFATQIMGWPTITGILIIMILSIFVAYKGTEFFNKCATGMAICMFIILLAIYISALLGVGAQNYPGDVVQNWMPEVPSVFNMGKMAMYVYAGSLPFLAIWLLNYDKFKTRKDVTSTLGLGFVFGLSAFVLPLFVLVRLLPHIMGYDIPVMYLLTDILRFPPATYAYAILLFLALLSTGSAVIVTISERGKRFIGERFKIKNKFLQSALIPLIVCLVAIPCSMGGILQMLFNWAGYIGIVSIIVLFLPLIIRGPILLFHANKRGIDRVPKETNIESDKYVIDN